jgi:hypothetical protein
MKMFAVLSLAALSFGLLGCPEEEAKPDPSKAAGAKAATSAAPAAAPAPTTKAKEEGGGW